MNNENQSSSVNTILLVLLLLLIVGAGVWYFTGGMQSAPNDVDISVNTPELMGESESN